MYKTVTKIRTVRTVDFDGGYLCFNFVRPPYDARCRDRIASVGFCQDPEKEIDTLRKCMTDPEIVKFYDDLAEARKASKYGAVRNYPLPKPIKVSVTVERSEYGW